jgi:hypothetical protein
MVTTPVVTLASCRSLGTVHHGHERSEFGRMALGAEQHDTPTPNEY